MQRAQREIRSLPNTLAKQVELDDLNQVKEQIEKDLSAPKKELEDLDKELVAWTRTEGQTPQKEQPERKEPENSGNSEKNDSQEDPAA